jgi:hypothetical protein
MKRMVFERKIVRIIPVDGALAGSVVVDGC